jgi:hypothetical protein
VHEFDREMLCVGTAPAISENEETTTGVESDRHRVTSPRNPLGIFCQTATRDRTAGKTIVHRRAVVH